MPGNRGRANLASKNSAVARRGLSPRKRYASERGDVGAGFTSKKNNSTRYSGEMADAATKEFALIRAKLLTALMNNLVDTFSQLDARAETTLQHLVVAVLDCHIEQKRIAGLLGVSRTSIDRWSKGSNIPRSPAFRAWAVQELLKFAREQALRTEKEGPDAAERPSEKSKSAEELPEPC